MARPKRVLEDKVPTFPASPAYKQWVWNEIRRRKWTQQRFVDEMKKADRTQTGGVLTAKSSTAWLTGFLGAEDAERRYWSNTELMPAMNKALGISPPPMCDPSDELAQIRDRFTSRWRKMTAKEQRILNDLIGRDDE
jgi:hypothetical protein